MRAREDEETLRQMQDARVEFGVGGVAEDLNPGRPSTDIADLQESEEEDLQESQVSSDSCTSPAFVVNCEVA